MTGTSARETSRPAKRQRPSATDRPGNIAPPVLFRLPSISQPPCEDDRFGSSAGISHGAPAMGVSGSAAASLATATHAAPQTAMPKPAAAVPDPSPALADKKAAGQRLFNTIIVALLLVALAIISVLAFRGGQPAAKPGLAGSESEPKDHLESLSDIRVPDISAQRANQPAEQPSAGQSAEANTPTAALAGGTQLSLDKPKSTVTSTGLTMDAADLAKKPSSAAAQVQLGTPVPMNSSALAASQGTASQSTNSNLPLTTPRYETVSTPSSAAGPSGAGASPNTGASPALYDGAKKPADQKSDANPELMISGSNDSETSLIPSAYSGSSAKTTAAQPVASKSPTPPQSDSLGVMVGAGMAEPEYPKAQATATPDLDIAAISSKFLEYSRQKTAAPASTSTEIVNPYAPTTPAAGSSAPATTVSTSGYSTGAYQQSPAGAGVPYGTTGTTLTPYVRNSPTGAVPSGIGSGSMSPGAVTPASASMQMAYPNANQPATTAAPGPSAATVYPSLSTGANYQQPSAPSGSAGYSTGYNTQPSGGFAIPPRGTSTAPSQTTRPSQPQAYGNPAGQNYGYASGTGGSATYQPSAVTSSSPYPGGQAPQGMIGQSGFATAPSGDVVGGAPIPVTGTMGYSTSPTR